MAQYASQNDTNCFYLEAMLTLIPSQILFKTSHKQELSPIMLPFSYCINPTLLIGRKFHHHGVESNKESADFQGELRESIQILFQFII